MWDIPLAHNTGIIVNHWHTPLISPGVRHVMPGPGDGKWPSAPSYPSHDNGWRHHKEHIPISPLPDLNIARYSSGWLWQCVSGPGGECGVSGVSGWRQLSLLVSLGPVWAGAHSASPRVSQAVQCRPGWLEGCSQPVPSAGTETQWRGLPVSAGAHNMHQQDQLW